MDGDSWLDLHRAAVEQLIAAETEQARLAQRIIPEVRVAQATLTYPEDMFDYKTGKVPDKQKQLRIGRFAEAVQITTQQTKETSPDRGLVAIRRATLELTQKHDRRVFRKEIANRIKAANPRRGRRDKAFHPIVKIKPGKSGTVGEALISAVAEADALLENEGYRSGKAMVVSQKLWTHLHRVSAGYSTLPIDAVRAMIEDGPVYQTSVLKGSDSLLISVGAGQIDRVVADDPQLEYVDQDKDKREFLLFERFIPRFRETKSAVLLRE